MNPRRLQTLVVSAFAVMTVVACASSTSDELAGQALTNQTKKDSGTVKPDTSVVVPPVVVDSALPPVEVDAGDTPIEEDAGDTPVELDSGTTPTGDAPACSSTLIAQIGNIDAELRRWPTASLLLVGFAVLLGGALMWRT